MSRWQFEILARARRYADGASVAEAAHVHPQLGLPWRQAVAVGDNHGEARRTCRRHGRGQTIDQDGIVPGNTGEPGAPDGRVRTLEQHGGFDIGNDDRRWGLRGHPKALGGAQAIAIGRGYGNSRRPRRNGENPELIPRHQSANDGPIRGASRQRQRIAVRIGEVLGTGPRARLPNRQGLGRNRVRHDGRPVGDDNIETLIGCQSAGIGGGHLHGSAALGHRTDGQRSACQRHGGHAVFRCLRCVGE